ncbi:hypothetical protein NHQ30_011543 [Ciborinia camelliae]|nr:hypothetical protein NHQ30_011543 [Ciborinia camelliae]
MGNCLTRLKAEMLAPPPNPGNWESFGPRKDVLIGPEHTQIRRRSGRGGSWSETLNERGNVVPFGRRETPSGIQGLSFDYAGRPVWRDPKLKTHDSDDSDI